MKMFNRSFGWTAGRLGSRPPAGYLAWLFGGVSSDQIVSEKLGSTDYTYTSNNCKRFTAANIDALYVEDLPQTADFTYDFYVKTGTLATNMRVFAQYTSQPGLDYLVDCIQCFIRTDGRLTLSVIKSASDSSNLETALGAITENTWYHIRVTRTSGEFEFLYGSIGGTLSSIGTITDQTDVSFNTNLYHGIGALIQVDGTTIIGSWNGLMSWAKLETTDPGKSFEYTFAAGIDPIEYDISGNGNHGTYSSGNLSAMAVQDNGAVAWNMKNGGFGGVLGDGATKFETGINARDVGYIEIFWQYQDTPATSQALFGVGRNTDSDGLFAIMTAGDDLICDYRDGRYIILDVPPYSFQKLVFDIDQAGNSMDIIVNDVLETTLNVTPATLPEDDTILLHGRKLDGDGGSLYSDISNIFYAVFKDHSGNILGDYVALQDGTYLNKLDGTILTGTGGSPSSVFYPETATSVVTKTNDAGFTHNRSESYISFPFYDHDFSTTDSWTTGADFSIAGGLLQCNGSGSATRTLSITPGKQYDVTLNITSFTSGSIEVSIGDGDYAELAAGNTGQQSFVVTAGGVHSLITIANTRFVPTTLIIDIDDITISEVATYTDMAEEADSDPRDDTLLWHFSRDDDYNIVDGIKYDPAATGDTLTALDTFLDGRHS